MASVLSTSESFIVDANATFKQLDKLFQDNFPSTVFPKLGVAKGNEVGVDFANQVADTFSRVFMTGICLVFTFFGVIFNLINIVVFVKQGFQDSVTISLFAIAVSDFISALTLLWLCICQNPLVLEADLPFLPLEVEIISGGIPHVMAINITGWLTALVTFERCICVAFPLKVKDILSKKTTQLSVLAICILVIGCNIPHYYIMRPGWKFLPDKNKTVLGVFDHKQELYPLNQVILYVANIMGPFLTFLCVSVCSTILIVQMNLRSKWRQSTTATGKGDSGKENELSTRDWKVIKMVAIVAVIFVSCFTPSVIISIIMASEPEFMFDGKYAVVFKIYVTIATFLEAINACSNIFIYFNMSSKYKAVFRTIFCPRIEEDGRK